MSLLEKAKDISISSDFEAFYFICSHLRSQNDKCLGVWGDCAYRGVEPLECNEYCDDHVDVCLENTARNGRACAIGVLIKEEFYSAELENNPIDEASVKKAVMDSHPNWKIGLISSSFLRLIQTVHDRNEPHLWPLFFLILSQNFVKATWEDPVRYVLNDAFINSDDYFHFASYEWRGKLPDSLGTVWADWNYLFSILDQMKELRSE